MKRAMSLTTLAAGTLALGLLTSSAFAGESFTAGLSGTVVPTAAGAPASFQIGPSAYTTTGGTLVAGSNAAGFTASAPGSFTSYTATPGLPQITGNDLNQFGFSLYANLVGFSGLTASYDGTYRIYAPGYGFGPNNDTYLSGGTFTATASFDNTGLVASVLGVFDATSGPLHPAGYPATVDFAAGSPAIFTGTFVSNANGSVQSLSGTLSTVPEPGSVAMFVGFGIAGLSLLRRRRA